MGRWLGREGCGGGFEGRVDWISVRAVEREVGEGAASMSRLWLAWAKLSVALDRTWKVILRGLH